jgi:hypothetical protein
MNPYIEDLKRQKVRHLQQTTGEIKYFVRLNPEVHLNEKCPWRECLPDEFFAVLRHDCFGGLIETRTTMDYYTDGRVRDIMI